MAKGFQWFSSYYAWLSSALQTSVPGGGGGEIGAGVAGAGVAGAAVGGAVACLVVGGGVGDGVAAQTSQILTLSSSMTPFSSTQYLVGEACPE